MFSTRCAMPRSVRPAGITFPSLTNVANFNRRNLIPAKPSVVQDPSNDPKVLLSRIGLNCDQWSRLSSDEKFSIATQVAPEIYDYGDHKEYAATWAVSSIDRYCTNRPVRTPNIPYPSGIDWRSRITDNSNPMSSDSALSQPCTLPVFPPEPVSFLSCSKMSCESWNSSSYDAKYRIVVSYYNPFGIHETQIPVAVKVIDDHCRQQMPAVPDVNDPKGILSSIGLSCDQWKNLDRDGKRSRLIRFAPYWATAALPLNGTILFFRLNEDGVDIAIKNIDKYCAPKPVALMNSIQPPRSTLIDWRYRVLSNPVVDPNSPDSVLRTLHITCVQWNQLTHSVKLALVSRSYPATSAPTIVANLDNYCAPVTYGMGVLSR